MSKESQASTQTVIDLEEKEKQLDSNLTSDEPVNETSINETNFNSVNNEIWSTITPQQDASLRALHQTMQLNELNQNQNLISSPTSTNEIVDNDDNKPIVGSSEWHKLRRENHKKVERRRREIINNGILELSRIVPGCEKNKGPILQRAAAYIRQLKDAETATVEKWTLEKLLTDQAISELNRQVEMLKVELDRIRLENNYLKRELENVHKCSHLHHVGSEKKRRLSQEED